MSGNLFFLFLLNFSPDFPVKEQKIGRNFFLFKVNEYKEGKKSAVFLLDEGVYIAKKGMITNVRAATGDSADDHIAYLQEYGVPIYVCTPCAKSRQISESDLIDGARMASGMELIHLACESAVI
jgi:predicted peroxiredoxin